MLVYICVGFRSFKIKVKIKKIAFLSCFAVRIQTQSCCRFFVYNFFFKKNESDNDSGLFANDTFNTLIIIFLMESKQWSDKDVHTVNNEKFQEHEKFFLNKTFVCKDFY